MNALRKDCPRPLCFGVPWPSPALCLVAFGAPRLLQPGAEPPTPALALWFDLSWCCSPARPDSARLFDRTRLGQGNRRQRYISLVPSMKVSAPRVLVGLDQLHKLEQA